MVASFEKPYEANGVVGTFPRGFSPSTNFAWQLVRADALVSLNYGKALVEKNRISGNVPVYGTNGQCGWHNTELAKGPGVILGRKGMGPLGVEWCESDFWVIDTAYYVSSKTPELNLKFFYYLIKYIGLNHLKDGTSNPSLSRDTFYAQLLPLPPLPEQKAIAHILGTLDDKIELNREMNKTLEAMARAIFKSWFVDFDPVRAKMEGRQPAGMDAATAELFPNEFEESALGMIPKGWQIEKVGDVMEAIDYVANGSFALLRENVQYLNEADFAILVRLADFNAGWNREFVYITEHAYNFLKKSYLEVDDVVIANVGANAGTVFRVPDLGKPMTLGPNAIIVKPRAKIAKMSKQYLYYYFSNPEGQNQLQSIKSGSAQPKFNKTDFRSLSLIVPKRDIVVSFSKFIEPIWQRQALNNQESRTLASIRDTLLPKLLSGEIRVKEADKIVERQL